MFATHRHATYAAAPGTPPDSMRAPYNQQYNLHPVAGTFSAAIRCRTVPSPLKSTAVHMIHTTKSTTTTVSTDTGKPELGSILSQCLPVSLQLLGVATQLYTTTASTTLSALRGASDSWRTTGSQTRIIGFAMLI
jgi:hypothetical protein